MKIEYCRAHPDTGDLTCDDCYKESHARIVIPLIERAKDAIYELIKWHNCEDGEECDYCETLTSAIDTISS